MIDHCAESGALVVHARMVHQVGKSRADSRDELGRRCAESGGDVDVRLDSPWAHTDARGADDFHHAPWDATGWDATGWDAVPWDAAVPDEASDDESCGVRVRTMVESPESSGLACSP